MTYLFTAVLKFLETLIIDMQEELEELIKFIIKIFTKKGENALEC